MRVLESTKFYIIMLNVVTISAIKWNDTSNDKGLLEAVYWEVKPYLFTNEGKVDGIIPKIFERAKYYCAKHIPKNMDALDFKHRMSSRKQFLHSAKNNLSAAKVQLQKSYWVPVLTLFNNTQKKRFRAERLVYFNLFKTGDIVLIVPRDLVSLPHKIFRGLISCRQIFLIAFLFAIFFGMVTWLAERKVNEDFNKGFIRGLGTGIWWSIVSMTTVGYGDICPKSAVGRIIAIFWLVIGVMIACIMTASMTNVVTGVADLSVGNQKISVLKDSYEEKVASNDYRAKTIPGESYEDVIELVRQQKVMGAMITEDVAAWYQREIVNDSSYMPLRIVKKFPANLYVDVLMTSNISNQVKSLINCMHSQSDEIYKKSQESFQKYCELEILYVAKHLFSGNLFIQVLIGTIIALIWIGVIYDLYNYGFFNCGEMKKISRASLIKKNGDQTDKLKMQMV